LHKGKKGNFFPQEKEGRHSEKDSPLQDEKGGLTPPEERKKEAHTAILSPVFPAEMEKRVSRLTLLGNRGQKKKANYVNKKKRSTLFSRRGLQDTAFSHFTEGGLPTSSERKGACRRKASLLDDRPP